MPRHLEPEERSEIDRFVAAVRDELRAWGDFRQHFAERTAPPGRAAFIAAREFSRWADSRYPSGGAESYPPELTNYLANRLTSEQLGFMREMIAFSRSYGGQFPNAQILRSLFNDSAGRRMPLIDLRHSYTLASAGRSGSGSFGIVGGGVDHVAIR